MKLFIRGLTPLRLHASILDSVVDWILSFFDWSFGEYCGFKLDIGFELSFHEVQVRLGQLFFKDIDWCEL